MKKLIAVFTLEEKASPSNKRFLKVYQGEQDSPSLTYSLTNLYGTSLSLSYLGYKNPPPHWMTDNHERTMDLIRLWAVESRIHRIIKSEYPPKTEKAHRVVNCPNCGHTVAIKKGG